jgi:hypothetical protein
MDNESGRKDIISTSVAPSGEALRSPEQLISQQLLGEVLPQYPM